MKKRRSVVLLCVVSSIFFTDLVLADELPNVFKTEEPECSVTCSADTVINSFLDDRIPGVRHSKENGKNLKNVLKLPCSNFRY